MEYREGQTATNPKTGQKLKYEGGFWVAVPGTGPGSPRVPSADQFLRERDSLETIDNLKQRSTWDNTGTIGGFLREVPGWNAYNFERDVDTLKGRTAFGELAAMRQASPTGGALGNVTEKELAMLQAAGANLDIAQSEKQFDANLDRLKGAVTQRTPGLTQANPVDLSGGQSRATIPTGAFYRDPKGNIRRNDNGDAGNPIIVPVRKPAASPVAAAPRKAAPAAASGAPVRVTSKEQFDRLPKGQRFIAPDGSLRIKP